MKTLIIGFSGKKSSGKTTCAETLKELILQKNSSQIIKICGFADPLKNICQKFFGLTLEQCYGTDEQKNTPTGIQWENFPVQELVKKLKRSGPMSAREVLQFFGTECLRQMESKAHVKALMWEIEKDHPTVALICDGRFP